jgi:two-component system sensor histidine kinase PhoQ
MPSIHVRVVVAASLVLAAFFGMTGWALDSAFRRSAETAMRDRLMGHVYALLAAADEDEYGLPRLPPALPDPRLNRPDSGLYAQLQAHDGHYRWASGSSLGRPPTPVLPVAPGERRFNRAQLANEPIARLQFGIAWEDLWGEEKRYTVAVSEHLGAHARTIGSFRATLWRWLGGSALLLLLVQGMVLQWGLRPLRTVVERLRRIEAGEAEGLGDAYPRELIGLTRSIDSLLAHSRTTQARYRDRLADLAHSLKTPLAILQGALADSDPRRLTDAVRDAVPTIDRMVRYQLDRAAVAGRASIVRPVPVEPVVRRIAASLEKVYRDKPVALARRLEPGVSFRGDEGDLFELLGNLMDNAYKHARKAVTVSARHLSGDSDTTARLELEVADDGPGIDPESAARLVKRGERADEHVPGHGIGLSVVSEVVRVYRGNLRIGRDRSLGGAAVTVTIPLW